MKIGIVADTHDNIPKIEKAVKVLKENGISAVLTIADLKYLEYPNELNIKHLKIVVGWI